MEPQNNEQKKSRITPQGFKPLMHYLKHIASVTALALLAGCTTASAQTPQMIAQISGDPGEKPRQQELRLSSVDIQTRVHGWLAETRMTMTFANPTNRTLAGDLYFPLPEGATVSGYALDINGTMVDGVVVEKDQARQVFEKIVRQGTDPGLVEWVKGNNFKTRVFPIPANGSRTVMVRYLSELTSDQGVPSYQLPLHYSKKVDDFHLRVEVVKGETAPVITSGGLPNLTFGKWRQSYLAETRLKDVAPSENLVISLPDLKKQRVVLEQAAGDATYFTINDFPPVPAAQQVAPPARVGILWDASGSRGQISHEREFAFLRAYFVRFKDATPEVELTLFRNEAEQAKRFSIKNGNVEKLIEELKKVFYDGGTRMSSIAPPEGAKLPNHYLLFSDGISNFGAEEPPRLPRPLYPISDDARANHTFLRYLAMKSGGEYYNLNSLDTETAAARVGAPGFTFLSADFDRDDITDVVPGLPQPVHGRFSVAGRLLADQATITLNYGIAGRTTHRVEYRLTKGDAVPGETCGLFWAMKRLDELQILPKKNRNEIIAIGKQFGLVTPGTSLLVLESLNQYVEHKIEPPASLPEMQRQYREIMAQRFDEGSRKKEDKLQYVLSLWQKRVAWWNKEFDYPADFRYADRKVKKAVHRNGGIPHEREASTAMMDEVMPSVAAPAPAAMPEQRLAARTRSNGGAVGGGLGADSEKLASKKESKGKNGEGENESYEPAKPTISITPWNPDTPYLKKLQAAPQTDRISLYRKMRSDYAASPAFFLDCADFFLKEGDRRQAVQALSNIAEMELENPALLRILAHRLAQLEMLETAALMFQEVLNMRPEEPQSHRDLALVLARRAEQNGHNKEQRGADYRRAIELLNHVVMTQWDRFAEIELIALTELNRIIPKAKKAGLEGIPVDPRLVKSLDMDVRIVLTWDADMTDLDLWVTEPSGEKCFYSHSLTTIGGSISRDITNGYGPEEYILKNGMEGGYKIEANYYGSNAPQLAGTATLQVEVYTNYGRPNEERKTITMRLAQKSSTVKIGEIEFRK